MFGEPSYDTNVFIKTTPPPSTHTHINMVIQRKKERKRDDRGFIMDNPKLTNMLNGNKLDEYILYNLVFWDKKKLNNLKDR